MFLGIDTPDQSGGYSITDTSNPVTESDEATNEDRSPAGQNTTQNPIRKTIRKISQFLEDYNDQITGAAAALGVVVFTWNTAQEVRS